MAGHLKLANLCWIYDNNQITIEGHTALTYSDDVATRFIGYGWNVTRVGDANDLEMLERAFTTFKNTHDRPTLIIVDTHIAYGAPHKQDTSAAHGEPLGNEVVEAWRLIMPFCHEPVALILTRQALPTLDRTTYASAEGVQRGAYILADADDGKQQLKLMLRQRYMHPNGQIPAYEWNFGDVNPPAHAWSTIFTYRLEQARKGEGDRELLKSSFQKLLLTFTWWVNRKDRSGRNVFEAGFLGLDNIGVFDRSAPLPTGGYLEQADGSAWMALFCQNMLEIAAELARTDPDYAEMALKFVEHFLWIASAMVHLGQDTGMWDEADGFFYDVLRLPNGQAQHLKVRSMVGLLPCVRRRRLTGH